tara:strand:+ start:10502 stop:10702 length:201 start_codon:yes stop_codon:yes gene_type:complete
MTDPEHRRYVAEALGEARQGLAEGSIPIGSVLVLDGQIVDRGHNRACNAAARHCTRRWTAWRTPVA